MKLSKEMAAWTAQVRDAYDLEPHHELLLEAAARSWDAAQEARRMIARDGMILKSATGLPRAHPAVKVAHQSSLDFAALVRQLKLDGDGRVKAPIPGVRSHKLRMV